MLTEEQTYERRSFDSREPWLKARREKLGASDSAMIVLGRGRQVYDSKVNGVEVEQNDAMTLGILTEPPVREACRRILKWSVDDPLPHELCVSGRVPFLSFSPDAWRCDDDKEMQPIQIKNVGMRSPDLHDVLNDKVPAYMYAQVQQEIFVSCVSKGYLVCLVGGCELKHFEIRRNDDYIDGLIDLLSEWRERYLIGGEKHPVDARQETARAIALSASYEAGSVCTLEGKAAQAAVEIPELEAQRSELDEKIDLRKNEIRQAIHEHESGISPDGREWYWTRGKSRQLRSREVRT